MALAYPTPQEETEPITGEELLKMANIGPCELIDGWIIPMSPTGNEHGIIEMNLAAALGPFVKARKLGWLTGGEAGIYTRRCPDRVRGMDVAFISRHRQPQRPERFLTVAPELIIEIISPNDTWLELRAKLSEYFAIGVDRVWVVEPKRKSVLVYSAPNQAVELGEDDLLEGEGPLADFEMAVSELFED